MSCINDFSLNELMVAIARGNISTEIKYNKDYSRYLVCYLTDESKGINKKEVYKIEGPKDYMVFSAILSKIEDALECYSINVFGLTEDMSSKVGNSLYKIRSDFRECEELIPYMYFDKNFVTDFKYMHINEKNKDYLVSLDCGRDFEFYFNLENKNFDRFENMYRISRSDNFNHDLRSVFRVLKFFDELGGQKRLSVPEIDLRMWTDFEVLYFCLLLQCFNRSWVKKAIEKRFGVRLVK